MTVRPPALGIWTIPAWAALHSRSFAARTAGGTPTPGIPLERQRSLEQLVENTLSNTRHIKRGKNSPIVMRRFNTGIAAVNARPGKPPIEPQAAEAFYAKAAADRTRLPPAVRAKFQAYKEKLAKKRFAPTATNTDYDRALREKRAQDMLGPTATTATTADLDRVRKAAQAERELGPTATIADLRKLQAQDRALAAQLGIDVKEIRRIWSQGPGSMEPSFSGSNQ